MDRVHGFDISHWQGSFDFPRAVSQGHKFCFVKATEGMQNIDNQFKRNWADGPRHGLLTGAYHFFHPDQDAGQQAAHFISVVGKPRIGDLPAVLDWETTDHMRASVQKAGALKWLRLVEAGTGKKPIIYIGSYFSDALGDMGDFSPYPLWLPHYTTHEPRLPKAWQAYTFWQYSSDNHLDKNYFNGSLAQLRSLAGVS